MAPTPTKPNPLPYLRPPLQDRSRRTLDRILDAAETLLSDRSFEQLTIADIVRRSRTSVGAFYNRFSDKDALLDAMYDRHQRQVIETGRIVLQPNHWRDQPISEIVRQIVRVVLTLYRDHRGLMRALVIRGYLKPDWRYGDCKQRDSLAVASVGRLFASRRAELKHPRPAFAASLGFLAVLATLREKVLFGESTAGALEVSDRTLERELARMWLAYMGAM